MAKMTRGVFPTLWIDKSPMNLCEIHGFQPKVVYDLPFLAR